MPPPLPPYTPIALLDPHMTPGGTTHTLGTPLIPPHTPTPVPPGPSPPTHSPVGYQAANLPPELMLGSICGMLVKIVPHAPSKPAYTATWACCWPPGGLVRPDGHTKHT